MGEGFGDTEDVCGILHVSDNIFHGLQTNRDTELIKSKELLVSYVGSYELLGGLIYGSGLLQGGVVVHASFTGTKLEI